MHFGTVKRIVKPGELESVRLESVVLGANAPVPEHAAAAVATIQASALESTLAVEAAEITAPLFIDAELPPLTNEEFLRLQLAMGAAEPDLGLESNIFGWAIPSFTDHAIAQYIKLLSEIRDRG